MFRRLTAVIACAALVTGCATSGRMRAAPGYRLGADQSRTDVPSKPMDRALLAEYVQKLALGSKVRVDRVNGKAVRGTLIKATDHVVVVQPRTRVPEPPVEIDLGEIVAVTPEAPNGVGKAVGIGLAAGLGGTLLGFLVLAAIFAGD